MKLVFGEPKNEGELNFSIGTLLFKNKQPGEMQWVSHPLKRWFGFTIGDNMFIGLMRFSPRTYRRTPPPDAQ